MRHGYIFLRILSLRLAVGLLFAFWSLAEQLVAMAAANMLPPRRIRRVVIRRRRRFRYRKQAKWLLLLCFGVYVVAVLRILRVSTTESDDETNQTVVETNYSADDIHRKTNVLGYATTMFVLVAILLPVLVPGANNFYFHTLLPRVRSLRAWVVVLFPSIEYVADAVRMAWRWCLGVENDSYDRTAAPTTTTFRVPIPRALADRTALAPPASMTVAETLEAFNRERAARGESTVSTESIEAYEQFLRDLASSVIIDEDNSTAESSRNTHSGISGAGLEALCPRWTIDGYTKENNEKEEETSDNLCHQYRHPLLSSQTECGICLDGFCQDTSLDLRTLPCQHIFHSHCIDQWLQRSVSCPICKRSVLAPPLFRSNRSIGNNNTDERGDEVHIL
jgi:hypothetical protein